MYSKYVRSREGDDCTVCTYTLKRTFRKLYFWEHVRQYFIAISNHQRHLSDRLFLVLSGRCAHIAGVLLRTTSRPPLRLQALFREVVDIITVAWRRPLVTTSPRPAWPTQLCCQTATATTPTSYRCLTCSNSSNNRDWQTLPQMTTVDALWRSTRGCPVD